jgi:hypothetical protein
MADDVVLGAKQLNNPKQVQPQLDTDRPSRSKTGMDVSNPSGRLSTDLTNPPKSSILVEKKDHPLIEHFNRPRTARRHFGAGIITEN